MLQLELILGRPSANKRNRLARAAADGTLRRRVLVWASFQFQGSSAAEIRMADRLLP
jgi:hypothetical protein